MMKAVAYVFLNNIQKLEKSSNCKNFDQAQLLLRKYHEYFQNIN